jgi:hypothetical protein
MKYLIMRFFSKNTLYFLAYVVYIFLIIALALIIIYPSLAVADPIIETKVTFKEGDLIPLEYINRTIALHATGTKAYQMQRTLFCESHYRNIKSRLPEESYGIAQIHLPSHPDITKEQALDPDFAIKWMANNWNTKWYAYSRLNDTCNVI